MFQKENISLYVPLDYLLNHNKIPSKTTIINLFISLNIGIVSDIYYNYDMYHRPTGMYIYFDHFYSSNNTSWVINEIYRKYVKLVFDIRNTYMKCYLNRYHYRIQQKITNSSIYNDYSLLLMRDRIQDKLASVDCEGIYLRPLLKRNYHITNQYTYYINELLDMYNSLIQNYSFMQLENDKNYAHINDYKIYLINSELNNSTNGIKTYNDKKQLQYKIYEIVMDMENKLGCSFS